MKTTLIGLALAAGSLTAPRARAQVVTQLQTSTLLDAERDGFRLSKDLFPGLSATRRVVGTARAHGGQAVVRLGSDRAAESLESKFIFVQQNDDRQFTLTAWVRQLPAPTRGSADSAAAFLLVKFYDEAKQPLLSRRVAAVPGLVGWQPLRLQLRVAGEGFMRVVLGSGGRGPTYFDDVTMSALLSSYDRTATAIPGPRADTVVVPLPAIPPPTAPLSPLLVLPPSRLAGWPMNSQENARFSILPQTSYGAQLDPALKSLPNNDPPPVGPGMAPPTVTVGRLGKGDTARVYFRFRHAAGADVPVVVAVSRAANRAITGYQVRLQPRGTTTRLQVTEGAGLQGVAGARGYLDFAALVTVSNTKSNFIHYSFTFRPDGSVVAREVLLDVASSSP